jgi:broad specificity phosphatase PhoE
MVTGLLASQWRLSDEGRRRCEPLADRLAAYDLVTVVSSEEPKAVQTGQIVAEALGLAFEAVPGLHEHERAVVKSIGSKEAFQAQVVRLFEHPGELVLGHETADQAHSRFAAAIADVIERHPSGSLAVVTHGTVLTLFVARANGLDPVPFWKRLGLPSFVVLTLPSFSLVEVVENVERG